MLGVLSRLFYIKQQVKNKYSNRRSKLNFSSNFNLLFVRTV